MSTSANHEQALDHAALEAELVEMVFDVGRSVQTHQGEVIAADFSGHA